MPSRPRYPAPPPHVPDVAAASSVVPWPLGGHPGLDTLGVKEEPLVAEGGKFAFLFFFEVGVLIFLVGG